MNTEFCQVCFVLRYREELTTCSKRKPVRLERTKKRELGTVKKLAHSLLQTMLVMASSCTLKLCVHVLNFNSFSGNNYHCLYVNNKPHLVLLM